MSRRTRLNASIGAADAAASFDAKGAATIAATGAIQAAENFDAAQLAAAINGLPVTPSPIALNLALGRR